MTVSAAAVTVTVTLWQLLFCRVGGHTATPHLCCHNLFYGCSAKASSLLKHMSYALLLRAYAACVCASLQLLLHVSGIWGELQDTLDFHKVKKPEGRQANNRLNNLRLLLQRAKRFSRQQEQEQEVDMPWLSEEGASEAPAAAQVPSALACCACLSPTATCLMMEMRRRAGVA